MRSLQSTIYLPTEKRLCFLRGKKRLKGESLILFMGHLFKKKFSDGQRLYFKIFVPTIVSHLSKCLKLMTFGRDVLKHAVRCKYLVKLLRLFITISFTKDERRLFLSIGWLWWATLWTTIHARVLLACLFKFKSFDQFNPPEPPQILDIYSVVVL